VRTLPFLLLLLSAGAASAAPARATEAPPTLRRFALVAGSNRGFPDRSPLRYAVSDAERFRQVLTSMGGVAPGDATLLREPAPRAFLAALAELGERAATARQSAARVEVLVYFSGHADEKGLMLGPERLLYRDLRAAIRVMPVDVGIAVLDACASGAITRLKGGQPQAGFLSDVSMDVQGYAFLASSSESEAAQESDRLGGSYFTQALLSGLRGAADVSGDGRVTLGEAYQFAFNETLAQTTTSEGGAQHPSYDIKMAGTGDVVMTDVRRISASLILGAEYEGRFYVLDAGQHQVAELQKAQGRAIELGLEPGDYHVYYEESEKLLSAPLKLVEGQRQELVRGGLKRARRLPTLSRGSRTAGDLLDGRTRIEWLASYGDQVSTFPGGSRISEDPWGVSALHWIRPDVALEVGALERGLIFDTSREGTFVGSIRGVLFGGRYYPRLSGRLRPYAMASVGVFDNVGIKVSLLQNTRTGLGTVVGGGADMYLGRRLSLSARAALNAVSGRESHLDVTFGAGWNFGGRRRQ
jgi:Caspase domain